MPTKVGLLKKVCPTWLFICRGAMLELRMTGLLTCWLRGCRVVEGGEAEVVQEEGGTATTVVFWRNQEKQNWLLHYNTSTYHSAAALYMSYIIVTISSSWQVTNRIQHKAHSRTRWYSQIILRSNFLRHHVYLPKVIIQVQNGNGVLNSVVSCLKCMELACF